MPASERPRPGPPARPRRGLSLKTRITASFVLVVLGGSAVSTIIGSSIVTEALLDQARQRVRHGLEAAGTLYARRRGGVRDSLARLASSRAFLAAREAGDAAGVAAALAAARADGGLSFIGYAGRDGGPTARPGRPSSPVPSGALGAALERGLRGETVSGTVVMPLAALSAEDPALAARARIPVVDTRAAGAAAGPTAEIDGGLVLLAVVPVSAAHGVVGAVYGGLLLNRDAALVDDVRDLLFGGDAAAARGTATVFLGDVRVATNVPGARGERALGTRASAAVAAAVLGQGRSWHARAFVVGAWYVAAYRPLVDLDGRIVGMLYVGVPEAPFLAARTGVMVVFLGVVAVGLLVVMGVTYLVTRSLVRPLEEMVTVTKGIAGGDLDRRVTVASGDEIGLLAGSFNQMVDSLQAMQAQLHGWAQTLEEKVRARTEELVKVQSAMAQSEKLASIGRLAAGVAHEINNPLGGILSLSMLALEAMPEGDPLRPDLETIVKQTLRCREIVKGLLAFSRQSEARAARTEVTPVVEGTLALLDRQALFLNVRTVRELAPRLPPVLIDPGQLQQVIMNIVLNAVDAMEENGELCVHTSLDAAAGEVVLRIRDSGRGIPEDVLPFIFEPFFTTKKVGKGTGLGLAIVHGIVTRARGRVEVATSPAGTTFTVRLPAAGEEAGS